MKNFLDKDFLLETETAKKLYHDHAAKVPIIDFHNHLNPKEIYEDKCYDNLAQVWLGGDHYKWRAMRAWGVPEEVVTGDADGYEKFTAWAETVQNAIGNPLYHWTHLELQRYFEIETPLSPDSAKEIWEKANEKLKTPEYSVRNLLRMQNVAVLCTTDDPADTLEYHKKLKADGFEIQVLPTFRPEKAIGIEKDGFAEYIEKLTKVSGMELKTVADLMQALIQRLDYFVEAGCRVSDHSLENSFYLPATEEEVNAVYQKRMAGAELTEEEYAKYHGYLLSGLGRAYAKRGLVMQLHIGALRNNSSRLYGKLGADVGVDGLGDFNYAPQLSALLDAMDKTDELPKTVLYYLNPKDADMLAVMAGCFQSNSNGTKGKVQLGSAWWFCDHKPGMERQMEALSSVGMISTFIGMLTDSRSFLSFPRHEYFRRILCNVIGKWVENGEYPDDMEYLGKLVENICCHNANAYFGF